MALPMALLIIGASLPLSLMSKNLYWLLSSSTLKLLFLPGLGMMLFYNAGIHLFSTEVTATLSTLLYLFSLSLWSYLIGFLGP